ncbi:hypothetical protein GCK72_007438 [Caenorhabditis remanei]|uniref:Uncharacterized protein n=1 Tax=Caenorhabditis remanei TaxID=31234 RepID=A0A6A5HJ50_CAERE|nr:hypothetical protein GCK72_007438 [Caenorhabditis remanei]KAF1767479.1 hypothetical protein GCK72_007438 [Caenorhabditis remanei]
MCNDGIEVESETNYFLHETDKCAHNKRTSSCGSKLLSYILKTGIIERPSNRPVINVRRLLILRQFNTVLGLDLIKRWIKHDVQIGQKLFCHTLFPTTFRNFFTLFGDRVVKSEDNYIRIRTDNESKHIHRGARRKKHAQSLSCHVIPSEQTIIEKEDDYYTSYDLLHYDETDDDYDDFDFFDELGFFDDNFDEEDSNVEDYGFNDDELDDEEDEELHYVQ